MRVWRVCLARHAADAFSGEGGLRHAARWHSKGVRIVYTAASLSLATLEFFVNLEPGEPPALVAISADIPESVRVELLETEALPPDWRRIPVPPSSQRIGARWVLSNSSAVLPVPSVVIPSERNCLLNPAHPDFKKIRIGKPEPFSLDQRMWKVS